MKKIKTTFLAFALAFVAFTFAGGEMGQAMAQERAGTSVPAEKTRSIAPERAQKVILKLKADDTKGSVCCTHWNTSTGGTGCASFPDECPSGQFKVDCGAKGCW